MTNAPRECGLNADWVNQCWHCGPSDTPNMNPNDFYVLDDFDEGTKTQCGYLVLQVTEYPDSGETKHKQIASFSSWADAVRFARSSAAEFHADKLRQELALKDMERETLEESVRALSVDVWSLTVDNPETATVESEENETDPVRIKLRECVKILQDIADSFEG